MSSCCSWMPMRLPIGACESINRPREPLFEPENAMRNPKETRQPTREDLFGFYQEATDEELANTGPLDPKKQRLPGQVLPRREDLFGITVTLHEGPAGKPS